MPITAVPGINEEHCRRVPFTAGIHAVMIRFSENPWRSEGLA